jgi:succinate dehydrogenase/fumarate reductase cytochrome b subunit (b558 family)
MSTVALAGPGTFLGSSIGKKVVMAVTGLMLFGFVLGHMAGNLQVYLPHPEEAMRSYALFLHGFLHGAGIWVARLGLLAAAVLHIWAATALTIQNKEARPVGYRQWVGWESTYASRTMRWSGVILLSFIIFHLLHLTTGQVHPQFEDMNPYRNLVTGFQQRLYRSSTSSRWCSSACTSRTASEHVADAGPLTPATRSSRRRPRSRSRASSSSGTSRSPSPCWRES